MVHLIVSVEVEERSSWLAEAAGCMLVIKVMKCE